MKRNRSQTGSTESYSGRQPRKIKVVKCEKTDDAGYPLLRYANLRLRKPIEEYMEVVSGIPR